MDQSPNLPLTDPEATRASLSRLVERSWCPLYVFFRAQQNRGHRDAEGLTQAFLAKATPEKGRFRGSLLACAENFALKDWSHQTAANLTGSRSPQHEPALIRSAPSSLDHLLNVLP
jgi:hypothetical protein